MLIYIAISTTYTYSREYNFDIYLVVSRVQGEFQS